MNKRIVLFSIVFLTTLFYTNAQSGIGIKAGFSYNTNGEFVNEVGTILDNKGSGKSGFNVGFYGKLDLGPIYVRPEIVYTKTTSEYVLNSEMADFNMSKIDVPVLVGFKVIGPVNIFAGPSFQYILDNDMNGLTFVAIEKNYSIGLNVGVSVELGSLGIDVRYERGFNQNEAEFISTNITDPSYRLDSRPEQIMLNLSYRLSHKKK